jgi:hypothetical protein
MLDRALDHYLSMASQQPFVLMPPTTTFGDLRPDFGETAEWQV